MALSSTCENMSAKHEKNTKEGRKAYTMAHELKLIKAIAGNNKNVRERALKKIDKWLQFRMKQIPLAEADAMRLWKGFFYAIWIADKPLVQEEQCDRVSSLVHLGNPQLSILFFKCGLKTLGNEWFGIDQLRLDKFLMFVRRLLRNGFLILRREKWNVKTIRAFNDALTETVLNVTQPPPVGLTMHFTEIYLEELAKVSQGQLNPHLISEFLRPFVKQLSLLKDSRQVSCIKKCLFKYLLEQSDSGFEYQAKFRAWSQQGFPGGSIDAMQRVPVSDDDEDSSRHEDAEEGAPENGPLDPRAGHVDVLLPQLKFVPKEIVALLKEYRFAEGSNTKCRKTIASIIEWFSKLSKGEYPLGMKRIELLKKDGYSTKTKNAVNRLVKFEKKLGLNKKRKLPDSVAEEEKPVKRTTKQKTEDEPKKKKRRKAAAPNDIIKQDLLEKLDLLNGFTNDTKSYKMRTRQNVATETENGYEFTFKRNSGRWYVYNCLGNESTLTDDSVCETPKKGESQKLFRQDKWDNDANVPILLQSKEKVTKKKGKSPKRKSKSMEATSTPVRNPFATPKTPGSAKKVKIDLKLNCSQEVHEHVRKVKDSPGIPFDAAKKPTKPLLKSRISTPIDPFYKRN